jgi:hypothetical protein
MMTDADNLYIPIGCYFELPFVMADVDNLHEKLGGYFIYFHNASGG